MRNSKLRGIRSSVFMKQFEWNEEKNELLKKSRNITFEEIVFSIKNGGLIETKDHPNQQKYPGQKLYVYSSFY